MEQKIIRISPYKTDEEYNEARSCVSLLISDTKWHQDIALNAAMQLTHLCKDKTGYGKPLKKLIGKIYAGYNLGEMDFKISEQLIKSFKLKNALDSPEFDMSLALLLFGLRMAKKDKELKSIIATIIFKIYAVKIEDRYYSLTSSKNKTEDSSTLLNAYSFGIHSEMCWLAAYLFIICPELMDRKYVMENEIYDVLPEIARKHLENKSAIVHPAAEFLSIACKVASEKYGKGRLSEAEKNDVFIKEYEGSDKKFTREFRNYAKEFISSNPFDGGLYEYAISGTGTNLSQTDLYSSDFWRLGSGRLAYQTELQTMWERYIKNTLGDIKENSDRFIKPFSVLKTGRPATTRASKDFSRIKQLNSQYGMGDRKFPFSFYDAMHSAFFFESCKYAFYGVDIYRILSERKFNGKEVDALAVIAVQKALFIIPESDKAGEDRKWTAFMFFAGDFCQKAYSDALINMADNLTKGKNNSPKINKKGQGSHLEKILDKNKELEDKLKDMEKDKQEALSDTKAENRELRKKVYELEKKIKEMEEKGKREKIKIPENNQEKINKCPEKNELTDEEIVKKFNELNKEKRILIWGARDNVQHRILEKCPDAILLDSDRDVSSMQMRGYDGLIILQGHTSHSSYWDVKKTANRAGVPYRQLDSTACNAERVFKEAIRLFKD